MLIKLKDLIGEYCSQRQNDVNKKGGEAIQELIIQNWNSEEKFEISFDGVKVATPSFLDEAFGKLILHYPLEDLQSKLIFLHIDKETKDKINKSIELRLKKEG